MHVVWGLLSAVILIALIYLGVSAVVSIGWAFGFGLISLVVFLLIFKVIDDFVGWGAVVTIIVVFILLEWFMW